MSQFQEFPPENGSFASDSRLIQDNLSILLVDDDPEQCRLIELLFRGKGIRIITANSGKSGLYHLINDRPDLVLLDIMMPEMDGLETLKMFREHAPTVPVIMLSALGSERYIIESLRFGADDYVVKPYNKHILLARVEAQLRRSSWNQQGNEAGDYDDGYLRVLLADKTVTVAGKKVKLTPLEFKLLSYLVRNTGRTRTFAQILENVWGETSNYNPEYVHVYISRLRQKLEKDPKQPLYIRTAHGIGYSFM